VIPGNHVIINSSTSFKIVFLKRFRKGRNYSDAGRDWGQEKKGMTEDEMAGWHH